MIREEHLEYCSVCLHRKMDMKKGLLCGLTQEYADFDTSCEQYEQEHIVLKSGSKEVGQVIETTSKIPDNHWKRTAWFALAMVLISSLHAILFIQITVDNPGGSLSDAIQQFSLFTLVEMLVPSIIWVFIGWETNQLKHGTIALGINLTTLIIRHYFESRSFFIMELPFLFSAIYFGIATLSNVKKRVAFSLISVLLAIGISGIMGFNTFGSDETFQAFSRLLFDDYDLSGGFITYELPKDISYFPVRLDRFIVNIFIYVLLFMLLSKLHEILRKNQNWEPNTLQLGRRISSLKMALYVFIFYSGIGLLAIGLLGIWNSYLLLKENTSWIEYYGTGYDFQLYYLFWFLCTLGSLYVLVLVYRKLLLEYYLDHHKPITWNFYFGQAPVIGIFVWIYNLLTFGSLIKSNRAQVSELVQPKAGVAGFVLFMSFLGLLLTMFAGQFEMQALIVGVISFVLILVYIFSSIGVYIFIAIYLLLFTSSVFYQLFGIGIDIPHGVITFSFFYTLAKLMILYPAFHITRFKIVIPEHKSSLKGE